MVFKCCGFSFGVYGFALDKSGLALDIVEFIYGIDGLKGLGFGLFVFALDVLFILFV